MLKQQIEQDLKTALLGGDKKTASTLRGVKAAILDVEIAKGIREQGLPDDEVINVLIKEAKKRQESAGLYTQGGSQERADAELEEKSIIERYLPAQLSEAELTQLIDQAIQKFGSAKQAMGQIIGEVKQQSKGAADGTTIARLVKERLSV